MAATSLAAQELVVRVLRDRFSSRLTHEQRQALEAVADTLEQLVQARGLAVEEASAEDEGPAAPDLADQLASAFVKILQLDPSAASPPRV